MIFLAGDEKRFYDFMARLDDKDKIAVISHIDPDGLSSAVIASKVVGKVDYLKFMDYRPGMLKSIIPELKKRKINKIIFTDLSIDSEKEDVDEIEKFAQMVVIDHHPFEKDLNSERTVFIKAESKYPASYMCHYLFSKIQEIPSWIAAIGILGDSPQTYNENNCEKVFDDFDLKGKQNLCSYLMNISLAFIYFRGREEKVYDVMIDAKKPEDIIVIKKYSDKVRKEFEEQEEKFEKEKEVYGNLIIFTMNPKYYVKSLLINKISTSENYRNNAIFFISNPESSKDDLLSVSGRSQSEGFDVGDFLKKVCKDIPNSTAGGHFHAAAAKLPRSYLKIFKENLIREYILMKK